MIRYDSLKIHEDAQKQMVTAQVTVLRDGSELVTMYPAKWVFHKQPDPPTTEVAIRRAFAEDVYVVLAQYDAGTQEVGLDINVNPLVNWVWLGFGILAIGTGIALLPETLFATALVRVPAHAVTTVACSCFRCCWRLRRFSRKQPTRAESSRRRRSSAGSTARSCAPAACRRGLDNCGMMNCQGHSVQTAKLRKLIAEGKSEDEILAIFVRDAGGQDILTSPIDRGFNRLAWLLPYAVAFGSLDRHLHHRAALVTVVAPCPRRRCGPRPDAERAARR